MTDQELDSINERVAKTLGHQYIANAWKAERQVNGDGGTLPNYSRSIEAAWEIVEHMAFQGITIRLFSISSGKYCVRFPSKTEWDGEAETVTLAICLAFLKLKESEVLTK